MKIRIIKSGRGYVLVDESNKVYTIGGFWRKTNDYGVLQFSTRSQAVAAKTRLMADE